MKGYQTGDIVKAVVTHGKRVGTYVGRMAVRATGSERNVSKAIPVCFSLATCPKARRLTHLACTR